MQNMQYTRPAPRWTRRDLAEHWRKSMRTIDRMARDGRLAPPNYIGGGKMPSWSDEQRIAAEKMPRKTKADADRAAPLNAGDIAVALGEARCEGRGGRRRCPLHNDRSLTLHDGDGHRRMSGKREA